MRKDEQQRREPEIPTSEIEMTLEQEASLKGARAQQKRDEESRENFIEFQMDRGMSREEAEAAAERNLRDLSEKSANRIRAQQARENSVSTQGTKRQVRGRIGR